MVDGRALAETTPGPLIMVVAFVGFVGGWAGQLFDPASFLAGYHARGDAVHVSASFVHLCRWALVESAWAAGNLLHRFPRLPRRWSASSLWPCFAYHVLWPGGFGAPSIDLLLDGAAYRRALPIRR
jgi:chromate transporter